MNFYQFFFFVLFYEVLFLSGLKGTVDIFKFVSIEFLELLKFYVAYFV